MGYGLGLGYRLMGFGSSFRQLNVEHLVIAYRKSGHRLIVLDYGGTLHVRESLLDKRQAFEMGEC
jgi:trehalose 6-phosphate synthase/phosphatase